MGTKKYPAPITKPHPLWFSQQSNPKPLFPHPITEVNTPILPGFTAASYLSLYIAEKPKLFLSDTNLIPNNAQSQNTAKPITPPTKAN